MARWVLGAPYSSKNRHFRSDISMLDRTKVRPSIMRSEFEIFVFWKSSDFGVLSGPDFHPLFKNNL